MIFPTSFCGFAGVVALKRRELGDRNVSLPATGTS
jgi:hypothetical protein